MGLCCLSQAGFFQKREEFLGTNEFHLQKFWFTLELNCLGINVLPPNIVLYLCHPVHLHVLTQPVHYPNGLMIQIIKL